MDGKRKGVKIESEIPYGEDLDADGEIDQRGRALGVADVVKVLGVAKVAADVAEAANELMDSFFPTIWNVFHDGSVDSVLGSIPGVVTIEVSIEYLRERIQEPGDTFSVTLCDCTRFVYRNYESDEFTSDLQVISDACPGILSADMRDEVCVVHCDCGVFEFIAKSGSLAINGSPYLLSDLLKVAQEYWKEWEAKPS